MRADPITGAEPVESETTVMAPLQPYEVRRDGRAHIVYARIPKRCRRAWDCLAGAYMGSEPQIVRETGCWRYIDIVVTTGHQCDDRKLRELVELNPDLIEVREHRSHTGSRYNTFRIIVCQMEMF